MSQSELADRNCVPCRGDEPPLQGEELRRLHARLDGGWRLVKEHHLEQTYRFPDFRRALDFTVKAGELAEEQGHHPDLLLSWGKVGVVLYTHKIDGLTESDFILAAKLDGLLPS